MRNLRSTPKSGAFNQTISRQTVKDYFLNLFRYNEWANRRLVVALSDVADAEPHALVLFSHLVMVEKLWLARLQHTGETFHLWAPLPISELVRQMQESARLWSTFLRGLAEPELNTIVPYVNSKGVSFENTISDIAAHTVNHSTHHRGQIIALIRRQGFIPPALDYIVYARKEE